ncbi:hypothetical protein [Oceaniglobus roseus]|uniref:hypothetical protein n=1 Tax=Oceaniglobus roseus TaxID=1737570 RepID=UPI000C7EF32F|nr:hypothetical protein [Kandeliimicrobium roseum]
MPYRTPSARRLLAATLALGCLAAVPLQARTLDMAFLPPTLEPQDVCSAAAAAEDREEDTGVDLGQEQLTDTVRILYLGRDIRRLQAEDADRWFDFISALITRRAEIDEEYQGGDEMLDRIALHVDAGRLDELRQKGLIAQLRAMDDALTNNQRMVLAQYYMSGTGVQADPDYARTLIVNAAYGGNANALLALARLELQGTPITEWEAPLELTVTMAFGGLLGQLNHGVCARAERIAREYQSGEVVSPNPAIAYQWRRFAADMGGAEAAWKVVEYQMGADAAEKDNEVLRRYLKLAVQRGIAVSDRQVAQLKASGGLDDAELNRILGFNLSEDKGRTRPSLVPMLELAVNVDGDTTDESSVYLDYLRELTTFDNAPGFVFTVLAKEILVRKGRWRGEDEAMPLLEEAAHRGDPEGMQILAGRLIRYRNDPAQLNRAADLLAETVSRHGMASSMQMLDGLFRCQAPDAPRLREAATWARNFRATEYDNVTVSATDLVALDPFKEPEVLGQIQSQALNNRVAALAQFAQRQQVDPAALPSSRELWAARLDNSDQALEAFVELEFELATNPQERALAVELFRRVYLNNGVTTALDLAIALTEDNARDPAVADEIVTLLKRAGARGEGAAIRLQARLQSRTRDPRAIYEDYAQVIEDRGDFLALMFAMPYVTNQKAADYVDRAVSLMTCGTKDVDELGEAAALRSAPDQSYHWRRVALAVEGGNVLSKLRLSDSQMAAFDRGAAPQAADVYARDLDEGDADAHRQLYRLTSDPDLQTYDPAKAANHLVALMQTRSDAALRFVLAAYRRAPAAVREIADARIDMNGLYQQAAAAGDVAAKVDFALMLRDTARSSGDLVTSAQLLGEAAEAGNAEAMAEYGHVLAYGIGVPRDVGQALGWLDRAAGLGATRAEGLANLLRLGAIQ